MTTRISALGRTPRDRWLCWALAVLAGSALLRIVSASLYASPVFADQGAAVEEVLSNWLGIASLLPWIAALMLALDAFRMEGERRIGRLRIAALLAVASFACEAGAALLGVLDLDGPLPRGYRLAVETATLSRAALVVAAVVAAAAFASARGRSDRERRIARAFVAVAVAYAFSVISALYYAIAYSNYPSHDNFTQGLRSEAFGALGVVVAAALIAAAFRRSSRAGTGADAASKRERPLSRAAWILTASYLIIALGEAQIAVGSTEIGYTGISEAAGWAGVAAGLTAAAAIALAAAGFRRSQRA